MKKVFFAVLACLIIVLGGCAMSPMQIIETERMVMAVIDPVMTQDCTLEVPPPPQSYTAMGVDEREDALTRYSIDQVNYTKACTIDKRKLRETLQKQQEQIDAHNAAEEARVTKLKAGDQ